MKRLSFVVMLSALLVPTLAAAQSALNGTWKIDISKVDFPEKPDVFLLPHIPGFLTVFSQSHFVAGARQIGLKNLTQDWIVIYYEDFHHLSGHLFDLGHNRLP